MAKGILTFEDLDKEMTKIDALGSIITTNEFSRIDEWIGLGNYLLNAQVSGSLFKGMPSNRSILLNGSTGTGKTFLSLNIAREAQKMGYYVIYGDSESAVDMDLVVKFGIDPNRLRYQPFRTALHVRHFVANLCETLREKKKKNIEIPKLMFIIDSLGNLGTEKERADAVSGSDKRDMTKQQNLRSLFRVITMDLAEFKIPLCMTNHTYSGIGMFAPPEIISGGGGALFNSSVILILTKAQLKDGDQEAQDAGVAKTGIIVTSKPFKNRFARPIPIKFHISFFKGMNPYVGLENYVSWDACGIQRGVLTEEIIEKPIFEEDGVTPKMSRGKQKIEKVKTGNIIFEADDKAKTYAVKHLGKNIKGSALFSSEVFTEDILRQLDEKVIKPMFELPKVVQDDNDLNEALGIIEDENENEMETTSLDFLENA